MLVCVSFIVADVSLLCYWWVVFVFVLVVVDCYLTENCWLVVRLFDVCFELWFKCFGVGLIVVLVNPGDCLCVFK